MGGEKSSDQTRHSSQVNPRGLGLQILFNVWALCGIFVIRFVRSIINIVTMKVSVSIEQPFLLNMINLKSYRI